MGVGLGCFVVSHRGLREVQGLGVRCVLGLRAKGCFAVSLGFRVWRLG